MGWNLLNRSHGQIDPYGNFYPSALVGAETETAKKRKLNQKLHNQHFNSAVETSDKRSAFRGEHIVSAYQQVQANNARMKDEMVHATSSGLYHRRRKIK